MATPEIKKGEFIYRDTLFVDLGENKRHPRASASDLKDLLLPKRGTSPAKDQVAHWYEAQLVHYGLPRVKDKNAAKVRLTNAITSKTLVVPAYITQMEANMKKEYAATLRKGKGAAKNAPETKTSVKGKKRKAEEGDTGAATTMRVRVNGIELDIDHRPGGSATVSKKPKKEPTVPQKVTPKPKAPQIPSANASRTTASASRPAAAATSPSRPASTTSTPRLKTKQTARRSQPFPQPGSSTRPPASSPQRIYDHTPASFHNTNTYDNYNNNIEMTMDSDHSDAPPPYDSLNFSSPPRNNKSNPVQISGTYTLRAHSPSNRPHHPTSLSLRIHHPTSSLWGTFTVGPKHGIIRMDRISGLASGETKTFGYRSEDDNSNNKLRFGRGCDGKMEFDGDGGVRGVMFGVMYGEDVEFEGDLVDPDDGLDVDILREDWDEFPDRAYGRV